MKRPTIAKWVLVVAAAAGIGVSIANHRTTAAVKGELMALQLAKLELKARATAIAEKVKRAELHATEAEIDSKALSRVAETFRASRGDAVATTHLVKPEESAGPGNRGKQVKAYDPHGSVAVRSSNPASSDPEQIRLMHERRYAQDTAKLRRNEAIRRAQLEDAVSRLEPVAKFALRIEAAEKLAALGEFSEARRTVEQALTEKPVEAPNSDALMRVRSLLETQKDPVAVTLISDGATTVSIAGHRLLASFISNQQSLLPGEYQVVGRRYGFKDFTVTLSVRNGEPPRTLTIVCDQPAE